MKSSGIARKVDELGRVVLPVELRRALGIAAGDGVDFTLDGGAIVVRKVETVCTFCGADEELRAFRERQVCSSCTSELSARS
jgi:AbrB family transcriptional regulator, transcriptional pleiotropic regulator of transition state genes